MKMLTDDKNRCCPICAYNLGALASFVPAGSDQRAPKRGDQTFCGQCGAVLIFDADLSLRKMTETEINALPPLQRELLREAMRLMEAHTGHPKPGTSPA